jgi:hypothetical protein
MGEIISYLGKVIDDHHIYKSFHPMCERQVKRYKRLYEQQWLEHGPLLNTFFNFENS